MALAQLIHPLQDSVLMTLSTLELILDLSKVIQAQTENRTLRRAELFKQKGQEFLTPPETTSNNQQHILQHLKSKHSVLCTANANVWPQCYDLHSCPQLGHELNEQLYLTINQKICYCPRRK